MITKKPFQTPYNRFDFYHQNEALLFQFILHECLLTHQLLKKKPDEKMLLRLLGDSHVRAWNGQKGHLQKLLHYHDLLISHFSDSKNPLIINTGKALDRAFIAAQECQKLLGETSALKPFQQLKREMKKVTQLLFDKIGDYRKNENILFFILRQHKQFDDLYGEPIVAKTFSSLFPGGLREAGVFIEENYSRRGFNHLLPIIHKKIKSLKNV